MFYKVASWLKFVGKESLEKCDDAVDSHYYSGNLKCFKVLTKKNGNAENVKLCFCNKAPKHLF